MTTNTEVFEAMPLGHVWKRARGVYLANWQDHDDTDPNEGWDAFPTLREAKAYVEESREPRGEKGSLVSIKRRRWVRVSESPLHWRLDADVVRETEEVDW